MACIAHARSGCDVQSHEIIDLVAMLGLGDGNKTAAGRLRNDVRRSIKSVFSSKTRDKLKNTEQRMAVRAQRPCDAPLACIP